MRQTRRLASLLICLLVGAPAAIHGLSDVPASAEIQEDTAGQVTINDDPTSNTTDAQLPISATIFSGVPGPRECRGSVMATLDVAPPPAGGGRTAAACYNLPSPAGCGNFVANKADGCEARLFAEPNCAMYTNTAVFIPESRAVGGLWRSISVQCGIPPPDPDSLGKPPLADLMTNVKKGPKSARARRSAAAAAAAAAALP
ncbi:hypothetical protein B0T26DRAFT_678688 [Lasiosphaeria miniovina]|uniref:Uncharacterized protein n=1 Tax=Lasiosphaeria miniovina TaxID=1954250 RepID=A0AA40A4P1_9PEZI|nr:uncharacterized protein B0T26DRAFT_678688 [Lasiosphaeria miniovina]KAK0709239.1 hypothetical protein B0T26DRAFT_678688 [Lasiosphaeria miniovina]